MVTQISVSFSKSKSKYFQRLKESWVFSFLQHVRKVRFLWLGTWPVRNEIVKMWSCSEQKFCIWLFGPFWEFLAFEKIWAKFWLIFMWYHIPCWERCRCMKGCDWPTWWCWRNDNRRLLLQLRCSNALCIMNTFFQHRDVHKDAWCKDSLGQRSLNDFCIVSADLFRSVLDVCVNRVRNSRPITTCRSATCIWTSLRGLHECSGPGDPTE